MKKLVSLVLLALVASLPVRAMTITRVVALDSTTGWAPLGPLLLASDGNFYGTTSAGGDDGAGCAAGCAGTVFKLTPQGQYTVLHTFVAGSSPVWGNGRTPKGGVVEGPDGWLYGTTYEGGVPFSYGIVYKVSKTGTFQKLHDFCYQSPCPDGANPEGELAWGGDGYFYGTTTAPIIKPYLFRIKPDGSDYTAPANFFENPLGTPSKGMVRASDGKLYGLARAGVYRYSPGTGLTQLYLFGAGATDGSNGSGPMIEGMDGNLYGTNLQGGANGAGTVFRITTAGAFTKIHDLVTATEKVFPHGLVQAPDGNLWGTTSNNSAAGGGGAVWAVTTGGASVDAASLTTTTGTVSLAPPTEGSDGRLWGTATAGGVGGFGTVFVVDAGLPPPAPGEASADASLRAAAYNKATGDVTISYDPACFAIGHHVVWGPLASVSTYAYSGQACFLGTTGTATFNPGAGSLFFLLVGNTATLEGSYGRRTGGIERPAATGLPGCSYTQNLTATCP